MGNRLVRTDVWPFLFIFYYNTSIRTVGFDYWWLVAYLSLSVNWLSQLDLRDLPDILIYID